MQLSTHQLLKLQSQNLSALDCSRFLQIIEVLFLIRNNSIQSYDLFELNFLPGSRGTDMPPQLGSILNLKHIN